MSDAGVCRGNYPYDLRELLGRNGHEVRNFGVTGISACGHLPEECLESRAAVPISNGTAHPPASIPRRLPLLVNASSSELARCSTALRTTKLLREALAFEPHVVLLMIGTNDAACVAAALTPSSHLPPYVMYR